MLAVREWAMGDKVMLATGSFTQLALLKYCLYGSAIFCCIQLPPSKPSNQFPWPRIEKKCRCHEAASTLNFPAVRMTPIKQIEELVAAMPTSLN